VPKPLNPAAVNPQRGTCRSCRRPVLWVRTTAGRPMPLDPEPTEAGNVLLEGGVPRQLTAAEVAGLSDADERERYLPHHATCPQGRAWRKS